MFTQPAGVIGLLMLIGLILTIAGLSALGVNETKPEPAADWVSHLLITAAVIGSLLISFTVVAFVTTSL